MSGATQRCLLVHNQGSGTGSTGGDDIPDDIGHRFELVTIDHAVDTITTALDAHTLSMVAVWGGDGSIRSVAQLLAGTDVALLACPGGTHNHFATDVGLDTVDAVRNALASPRHESVDVGIAGDQVFLNNANTGWYVDLVSRRQRLEERMPRRLAKILSVLIQLFRLRRLYVELDGKAHTVWVAWVGNGRFGMEPGTLAERDGLANGKLDVRLLLAKGRFPKLRALTALIQGEATSSPLMVRRVVDECTFSFRRESVRFALDGELTRLVSPVQVVCRPSSLSVIVGPPAADTAPV